MLLTFRGLTKKLPSFRIVKIKRPFPLPLLSNNAQFRGTARLLPRCHVLVRQAPPAHVPLNEPHLPGGVLADGGHDDGAGQRRGPVLWRWGWRGGWCADGAGVLEAGVGGAELGRGAHEVRAPRGVRHAHVRVAQLAAAGLRRQRCGAGPGRGESDMYSFHFIWMGILRAHLRTQDDTWSCMRCSGTASVQPPHRR